MLTTAVSFRTITRDLDRSLQQIAAEPRVALETAYYRENIDKVRSIDDLLKDRRLFRFAMKAFGLEDMAHARAFMRKVMTEGVANPASFAKRLSDNRFVRFAETFDFARYGEFTTARAAAREGVVEAYLRQSLENRAGEENEGVRLALYFQREAPKVASAYGLLADPALYEVIKIAFGFPDALSAADIDKQAKAILDRLDLADLRNPARLDHLIARFAAAWDMRSGARPDPVLSLFGARPAGLDPDLIATLSTLKHGGS